MKIVDDLPETAEEGEVVWIMFAAGVGDQFTYENGQWYRSGAMNCPYIPLFAEENHPPLANLSRDC